MLMLILHILTGRPPKTTLHTPQVPLLAKPPCHLPPIHTQPLLSPSLTPFQTPTPTLTVQQQPLSWLQCMLSSTTHRCRPHLMGSSLQGFPIRMTLVLIRKIRGSISSS